jgi:energy-coupling factor transporter ATP-binding protein EcfA2
MTSTANAMRRPLANFSIRHSIISYPAFEGALARIERLHKRSISSGHSGGLLIIGLSGAGKSTVKNQYEGRFPRKDEGEITLIPVLKVDAPAGPTVKNLAEEILVALGDPMAHQGSAEQKTQRIYYFMKMCQVELLLIDEFQHFVENARRNEIARVTDWLKSLINHARIPVVLFGLPNCEQILKINPQLARRFSSRYSLRGFGFSSDDEIKEFRGVLKVVEDLLPLPSISLSSNAMAKRFFYATFGLIDYVGKIVDGAVQLAAIEGAKKLEDRHYAEAFVEEVWRDVPEKLNPFSKEAKLRLLIKSNEPFGAIAGKYEDKSAIDAIKLASGL